MKKFSATTILSVLVALTSVIVCLSYLRDNEKLKKLQNDQRRTDHIQNRMLQEQSQLLINLYTEVEQLKNKNDGIKLAPELSAPPIVHL